MSRESQSLKYTHITECSSLVPSHYTEMSSGEFKANSYYMYYCTSKLIIALHLLLQHHWPSSLQKFLKECDRLSYLSQDLGPQTSCRSNNSTTTCSSNSNISSHSKTNSLQIPQELTLGLTVKKKHEITTLLGVVKKILDLTGSRHILDIGSGKVGPVFI